MHRDCKWLISTSLLVMQAWGHSIVNCTKNLMATYCWRCIYSSSWQVVMCSTTDDKPSSEQISSVSTAGLLQFREMDILSALSRTKPEIQHAIVLTDWYSKLTRVIPDIKETSTNAESDFGEIWVIIDGTSAYLLAEKGTKLVLKVFAAVTVHLIVETFDHDFISHPYQQTSREFHLNDSRTSSSLCCRTPVRVRPVHTPATACILLPNPSLDEQIAV